MGCYRDISCGDSDAQITTLLALCGETLSMCIGHVVIPAASQLRRSILLTTCNTIRSVVYPLANSSCSQKHLVEWKFRAGKLQGNGTNPARFAELGMNV